MGIEAALETGESSAILEIEKYSSYAEMIYRDSVGATKLGVISRQRIIKDLELLRDWQKMSILVNLGLSGVFYGNGGEYDKEEYWYRVEEYFRQNFIDNRKPAIIDRKHNLGLVLVVGNSVPK